MVGKEAVGRNLVQELAGRGHEPPTRFVQSEENRPIGVQPLADGVPVVDLHRLCQPDGDDEANQLKTALTEWGLFHVLSDELSASFLNEVQSVAKKFFHLPIEEKLKYSNITVEGEFQYEGYGNDRVATEDQIIDWNDRLYLLVQPENERNLQLWPDNPSSFRSVLHEFSMKSRKIADNVVRAIAKLLELEENYFTEQLGDSATVYARFNYYPSCPRSDAVIGMKPHSDGSVITILLLDNDVDGLQVLKDGEWFSVPLVPHALLVNLGDQMEGIAFISFLWFLYLVDSNKLLKNLTLFCEISSLEKHFNVFCWVFYFVPFPMFKASHAKKYFLANLEQSHLH